MVKKILIAEDIDSINTGIISILQDRFSFIIEHSNSCDNAYLKIIRSLQDGHPFDLLISDLSFKIEGFLTQELKGGEDLVNAARKIQPNLKTIIYTIEEKPSLLKRLKEDSRVNGIVLKGQKSLNELCNAIEAVQKHKDYFTNEVQAILKNDSTTAIQGYDITLLELLSKGFTQQEISAALKEREIKPSSVSAIEKRIGELKQNLKANNSIHMVAIAKDMCLI